MANKKVGPARWLAALLAAFMLATAAHAQERLTLNFANTDIEAVARAMADFTGRTFIVDPRVKGTVTLNVDQPMTPDEALAALSTALRLQNIALVDAGGVIRVVPEADAKLQGGSVQTGTPAVGRGEQVVTQVFKLNYESAVSIATVLRPLVASNNPINAYAGNNTIVVTDYAENVRRIGRIIAAIDTPSSAEVDVVRLENTVASDMAALLARLLEGPGQATDPTGRVTILAEPTTNSLLIRAPTAARASLVRTLVTKLDQPSAAPGNIHVVYLKNANATVLARTNFGTAGQNILGVAQNPATVGHGLSIGVAKGQITLPGIGTIANLQFLARALESMSKANILSTPNILTLDNEEARIIVGQNVPFITGQFISAASAGAATVNPFQTIERRDVGLTLRVRPQISEGGTIKLVIYQEVSSVEDRTVAAGIITNMRAIETNVLVDDGAIVVLGGLVQDNVSSTVEKVPLLGDIPLLGQLFRFETRRQQKTNLMVFLRPFVVRDESTARLLAVHRYDQMRRVEEATTTDPHLLLPELPAPVMPPLAPR